MKIKGRESRTVEVDVSLEDAARAVSGALLTAYGLAPGARMFDGKISLLSYKTGCRQILAARPTDEQKKVLALVEDLRLLVAEVKS